VGGFTIGDAVYLAQMWTGRVNVTRCNGGDLNGANGFILNDALFLAKVWSGAASFLWDEESG